MTTLNTTFERPKAIPGFSCVKMKQEIHEQIYRETEGMTDEEVREYIRKGSEEFQKECEEIRARMK